MNVMMAWAWMLSLSYAVEHEHYCGLGMDALDAVEHERYYGLGMEGLVSVCSRT